MCGTTTIVDVRRQKVKQQHLFNNEFTSDSEPNFSSKMRHSRDALAMAQALRHPAFHRRIPPSTPGQ